MALLFVKSISSHLTFTTLWALELAITFHGKLNSIFPNLRQIVEQVIIPAEKKLDMLLWINTPSGDLSLKDAYLFKAHHFRSCTGPKLSEVLIYLRLDPWLPGELCMTICLQMKDSWREVVISHLFVTCAWIMLKQPSICSLIVLMLSEFGTGSLLPLASTCMCLGVLEKS